MNTRPPAPIRWLRATRQFLRELLTPTVRQVIYYVFAAYAGLITIDGVADGQEDDAIRRALYALVLVLAGRRVPEADDAQARRNSG